MAGRPGCIFRISSHVFEVFLAWGIVGAAAAAGGTGSLEWSAITEDDITLLYWAFDRECLELGKLNVLGVMGG